MSSFKTNILSHLSDIKGNGSFVSHEDVELLEKVKEEMGR